MHVLHLGILLWACGSLLFQQCQHNFWGHFRGDQRVRANLQLRVAFKDLDDWCKETLMYAGTLN